MKVFVKILLGLFVVAGVGLGARVFLLSDFLRLKTVTTKVQASATAKVYTTALEGKLATLVKKLEGQPIWQVGLKDFSSELLSDPRVGDFRIHRVWPDRLQIEAELSHVKALLWVEGSVFGVSETGTILPALPKSLAPDLPILRGEVFRQNQEARTKALQLLTELESRTYFTAKTVSEIHFDPSQGIHLFLTNNAAEVRMGHGDFSRRALMVDKVLNYLFHEQMNARVIDARFTKKVVVRLRNHS